MATPTAAQLQARLAQLQRVAMSPYAQGGGMLSPFERGQTNRVSQQEHDAAMAELASLQPQLAALQGSDPNDPMNRVEDARKKMYGLAQGRLDALQGDPLDELISSQLKPMITGDVAPYDAKTTNALITGATQGNADAAGSQFQSLLADYVAGGGNPNDPALLAEKRSIENSRLGRNQDASLGILQNANVQNYNARRGAMGQAAGFNSARNSAITNQANYLSGLYSHEYATRETPGQSFTYGGSGMQPIGGTDNTPGRYSGSPTQHWNQAAPPAPTSFAAWQGYSAQPQQPQTYTPAYYGSSARNFGAQPVPQQTQTLQVAAPAFDPNWVYKSQDEESQKARLAPQRARQLNPNEMYQGY